jgi:hypothetical protein
MTKNAFISKVTLELLEQNYSIKLLQKKHVKGCGGWFDSEKKEFFVAMKNPFSFETFVHEYCHYLQYTTDLDFWNKYAKGEFFDDFACKSKKESLILEHDCETRALKLINDLNLPVNVDRYIQATNVYLFSYHIMQEKKKWPNTSLYSVPELVENMTTTFYDLDYYLDKRNVPKFFKTKVIQDYYK